MNAQTRHPSARRALTLARFAGACLTLAALTPVSSLAQTVDMAALVAAADPAAGQTVSFQCLGCHTVGEGEGTRVGPNLYGIVGRPVASVEGFNFSAPLAAVGANGGVWTIEFLSDFLMSPQTAVPGTRMGFGGIADDATRANLIAYLATLGAATPMQEGNAEPAMTQVTFDPEQAARGESRFMRDCSECHGDDLEGGVNGGPILRGLAFEEKYADGAPASVLFSFISTNMPPESPGRFSAAVYTDLMAFLLRELGFQAGDPLPSDIDALSHLSMVK